MAERNRLLDYMPEGSDPYYGQDYNRLMSDTVVDRASVLPLATYADGGTRLAVPGMLQSPWDAFWNAGQAASQGDWRGAGLAAGEAAGAAMVGGLVSPKPAGALGTFGGRLAKTADQAALARAEEMAAQGIPREQIWNDTGWFQDPSKNWWFEIDDSRIGFDKSKIGGGHRVGDALSHDELFATYPDLARIRTRDKAAPGNAGEYRSFPREKIAIDAREQSRLGQDGDSTMLHELQHAIRRREGALQRHDPENYDNLMSEVEARAVQARQGLSAAQRQEMPPWMSYDVPEDEIITRNKWSTGDKIATAGMVGGAALAGAPFIEYLLRQDSRDAEAQPGGFYGRR